MHFGKLTALYPTDERADSGSVVWHCVCECGKEKDVSARRLTRGKVRSCGCLSNPPLKDYVGKTFGRLTVMEYAGTGKELGYKSSKLRYWRCCCECGKETVVGQTDLQNGLTESCGCIQKERTREAIKCIDNTSVVILERNKHIIRSDNISGKTGVSWDKNAQRWVAKITFKKKNYWLGYYKDKDEAIKVRTTAEEMYDDFLNWYYSRQKEK